MKPRDSAFQRNHSCRVSNLKSKRVLGNEVKAVDFLRFRMKNSHATYSQKKENCSTKKKSSPNLSFLKFALI